MRVAVLDYTTGNVDVFGAPEHVGPSDMEEYLIKEKGYVHTSIEWMCGVSKVNIEL